MKRLQIAVIGSAWQCEYPEQVMDFEKQYELAYQIWTMIWSQWYITITWWKSWIMEWASKWAKEVWWITVWFIKWSKRWASNNYIDVEVVTNMWDGWDAFMIPYSADIAFVIGGWVGTLKEMSGFYLQSKKTYAIKWTWWWAEKLSDTYLDQRKLMKIEAISIDKVEGVLNSYTKDDF